MRRRKIALIAGCVTIAILVAVVRHFQLRSALTGYIAALKAKGEPIDLAQVIPPPTPPAQNAAPFVFSSLTNLERLETSLTNPPSPMLLLASGKALAAWQQPDVRSSCGTNSWEDLARDLSAGKEQLDILGALSNRPVLDFHIDYEHAATVSLPHILPLRRSANVLAATAICNLHHGNVTTACDDIRTILALVNGQTEEPLLISQTIRLGIVSIAAQVTWEALQHPNVSANDLELLQRDWRSLNFIIPAERAYLMERVLAIQASDYYRRNPDELWQWVMGGKIDKLLYKNQWRFYWSYADERRTLEIYGVLLNAARMAETNGSYKSAKSFVTTSFARMGIDKPQLHKDFFRIDTDESEMRWNFSERAHDSFHLLGSALTDETLRNIAITAIALKRYELRHQHLPDKLQDLVPDFLKTLPIDWMDGQTLRYRPNADGTFLLYSVGEDGNDDGGNPSWRKHPGDPNNRDRYFYWPNPDSLDWVWPQAAESGQFNPGG